MSPSRLARSPVGVVVLVAAGLGLAMAAVHSVFLTEATEVAPQQAIASPSRVGPDQNHVAPPVEAAGYGGRGTLTLAALRGHPVVLNFWASWCPSCRAETALLEDAYRRYHVRRLMVLGIDARTDTWGASALFLRQQDVTYPVGRDTEGTIARSYRLADLPTTYFIGADGRVVGPPITGGFTGEAGAQELDRDIQQLLQ